MALCGCPKTGPQRAPVLPERYTELCAIHQLWMLSPMLMGIPLECAHADARFWSRGPWLAHLPRTHLAQMSMRLRAWERGISEHEYYDGEAYLYRLSEAVTVVTMVEYAVETYGQERLPMLVTGLDKHDNWESLLTAVFDVSAAEFEAGWQAYLAHRYQ